MPKVDTVNLYKNNLFIFYIARKEEDPKEALIEFQSVVDTEEEKGDW